MSLTRVDIDDMIEGLKKRPAKKWNSLGKAKGDHKIIEDWLEEEDAKEVARRNGVSSAEVYKVITNNGII